MQVGILRTDYGPHPPEKWAVATAGQIIQIGATASGKQEVEARKLELKIIDALEAAHDKVQVVERQKLAEVGYERLLHPLEADEDHVSATLVLVLDAASASPWAQWFQRPIVQEHVTNILRQHFASAMHIERSWHADGMKINQKLRAEPREGHDPNNEYVKAWRAHYHPGPKSIGA